jgi:hypothetical protein
MQLEKHAKGVLFPIIPAVPLSTLPTSIRLLVSEPVNMYLEPNLTWVFTLKQGSTDRGSGCPFIS